MPQISKHILFFVNKHQRVLTLALFLPSPSSCSFAPLRPAEPQFWAEDSTVFFDQAAHLGIASLTQPFVGYQLGFSRLIAWIASLLPSAAAPGIYAWSAYLAALVAIVLIARSSVGGHRAIGLIAALAITLTPICLRRSSGP